MSMPEAAASLRVAVVEDDLRFRDTLEKFFASMPGFRVAGSFGSAPALLQALERSRVRGQAVPWDVVLMDLELPGMSGIEATRQLKRRLPELPVVVLTVFEEPATILEAISAGADGYLVKRISAPELRSQLHSILQEGAPLTPGVARTVLSFVREMRLGTRPRTLPPPTRLDLTQREQDVLRCVVQGMTYKQAAERLGVSLETVRTHIRNTYRKLQVHTVAEAVSHAIRHRLI
jgi:DNA-binding NarL/FixJ family response regulator